MIVIKFKPETVRSDIVFCIVDNTNNAANGYAKEIVKNQADYTISNIVKKGYEIYQGFDEDELLREASLKYNHAVVFSTGTEFIEGDQFFKNIEILKNKKVALAGHILDRDDAYYELHHQCYYLNLEIYKNLDCPEIGKQILGDKHTQIIPLRSVENFHDSYTPVWIDTGNTEKYFNHKCHGWNIISLLLKNKLSVLPFSNELRNSKIYLYPESIKDFNKQMGWINFRQSHCLTSFVHTANTDFDEMFPDTDIEQLITTASGINFLLEKNINSIKKIVFYDYNETALAYWKKQKPLRQSIDYNYINLDLLNTKICIEDVIDPKYAEKTLINVCNIFCYEGTSCFASLSYRIFKENEFIIAVKEFAPDAYIKITVRASCGFENSNLSNPIIMKAKDFPLIDASRLTLPTWHYNESV